MQRFSVLKYTAAIAMFICICTALRADDFKQAPVSPEEAVGDAVLQVPTTWAWFIDTYGAAAKDPEIMGVAAVWKANQILESQTPQARIEYFQKQLYQAKGHAVQRAIRMVLADLYKSQNQDDQALQQLSELISDSQ